MKQAAVREYLTALARQIDQALGKLGALADDAQQSERRRVGFRPSSAFAMTGRS